jgi:nucleotide sugar dehydrogenase
MSYKKQKIGIVGLGFVGSAIRKSFSEIFYSTVLIDSDPSKGCHGTYDELLECEGIFVCVPSPQNLDGSCNTGILESVLKNLKEYNGVIISKVTAPPDVYQRLNKTYKNLVHSPEFLTASNADYDYINGKFAIIGGDITAYVNEAERIIKCSQSSLEKIQKCSIGEAALAKYAINSFLATKVVFMNELQSLTTTAGLDYQTVAELMTMDSRIGNSHMQVPGPDGNFGFGGMCFPKDTSALLSYAELINCRLNVLDSAVKKNTLLRLQEPK